MNKDESGDVRGFRRCIVCGKKCVESDRNTDKTYAHAECLRQHMQRTLRNSGDNERRE